MTASSAAGTIGARLDYTWHTWQQKTTWSQTRSWIESFRGEQQLNDGSLLVLPSLRSIRILRIIKITRTSACSFGLDKFLTHCWACAISNGRSFQHPCMGLGKKHEGRLENAEVASFQAVVLDELQQKQVIL
jgi:hypothetical protein